MPVLKYTTTSSSRNAGSVRKHMNSIVEFMNVEYPDVTVDVSFIIENGSIRLSMIMEPSTDEQAAAINDFINFDSTGSCERDIAHLQKIHIPGSADYGSSEPDLSTEHLCGFATPDNVDTFIPKHMELRVNHFHDGNDTDRAFRGNTGAKFATCAVIIDKTRDSIVATGSAFCSPKDQPNRRRGWDIAVRRALVNYRKSHGWKNV